MHTCMQVKNDCADISVEIDGALMECFNFVFYSSQVIELNTCTVTLGTGVGWGGVGVRGMLCSTEPPFLC